MRGIVATPLVVGMLSVAQAGQQEERFKLPEGVAGYKTILLVNWLVVQKPIQTELKMTDEQVTKVNEWNKTFATKTNGILKFPSDIRDFDWKEITDEKMIPRVIEVGKVAYKELGEILNKEQIHRLKQINRQNMGLNVFAEVMIELKLTDKQKADIAKLASDFGMQCERIGGIDVELRPDGKIDPKIMKEKQKAARKKVAKFQEEATVKVVELLDQEQRKTWKELLSEAFDLTTLSPHGYER